MTIIPSGRCVMRCLACLTVACTTLLATPAWAYECPTPSTKDPAKAKAEARDLGRKSWSIAAAYYRDGKYRQAMEAWLCASRLYPKPPATAFYNAGRAAERAGLTAQAIKHYRKYLSLRPDAPERPQIEPTLRRLEQELARRPPPRPRRRAAPDPAHRRAAPDPARRRATALPKDVSPDPRAKGSRGAGLAVGGYVALGVGSALAVAAATFCGLFWQAKDTVENPGDDADWNDDVKTAYTRFATYRNLAWATGAVAGATLVTATILLILHRRRRAERPLTVAPGLGPGGPALVLGGQF